MSGVPPKDVPQPTPKVELMSPLEEFCAEKLQEFDDLDEGARRAAAESIRIACESSDSDDSCLVHISSPAILTSPDEHTTPEPGGAAAGGLSDADVQGAVGNTLQFLNTDLIKTPVEEQPRRFKAFLDRFKKSGEETSLSERFKLFMMLTTAKEYVKRKWRKVTKKKIEEDSESDSTSVYTQNSTGGHETDDEYSKSTIDDENAKGGDKNAKGGDKNPKGGDKNAKGGDGNSNSKGGDGNSKVERGVWC